MIPISPLTAIGGGLLIEFSAALFLVLSGRIAGMAIERFRPLRLSGAEAARHSG
jgi:hypothetical protein